ncbi:MAG: CaiB/BaiF CoA-transferase family protein [Chloroflexota bacterium]|nr:CaiB/BaiF CoA-transferase family protein [Chloroflexota bacterium]
MPALEGIKILELAQTPIAALCDMILGDFGADILKIDSPAGAGMFASPPDEIAYDPLHRNKRNMALNLRSEEGRKVFLELVKDADVVVEGFRPGVMKRLGIDYETISKLNPRIIYCSISGYGQDGPYRELPGHDLNYISIAGALGLVGKSDGPPIIPLNWVADWAGGVLHSAIGILLAITARGNTGKGQYVDISMTDGAVALLSAMTGNYFQKGIVPKRGDVFLASTYPYYDVYEAKDGRYISIGCLESVFWENLCRELGREDLIPFQFSSEHRFHKAEGEEWEAVTSFLKTTFRTKTADEWVELLGPKNIPITKVNNIDEVFSNPQVLHRKMLVEMDHAELGKVKQLGIAIKLSDTPGEIRSFAPLPGAHTDEVMNNLGYAASDIERMRAAGVIA